jgi:cytochrome c oxidase cbb3-type subunit 3
MRLVFAFAALSSLALAACDRAPGGTGLPEWTPKDHDRVEENQRIQQGAQPGAQAKLTPEQQLAEATWSAKCASCHGPIGHGDGPSGNIVKASDLTRDEWQAKVSDGEIAAVIKSGRGRMPGFPDLPDSTVAALVARIRATRGR